MTLSYREATGDDFQGRGYNTEVITLVAFGYDVGGTPVFARYAEIDTMVAEFEADIGSYSIGSPNVFLGFYEGRLLSVDSLKIEQPASDVKPSDSVSYTGCNITLANVSAPAGGFTGTFYSGVRVYVFQKATGGKVKCLFYGRVKQVNYNETTVSVNCIDNLWYVLQEARGINVIDKVSFPDSDPSVYGRMAPVIIGAMTSAGTTRRGEIELISVNGSEDLEEWERNTRYCVAGHVCSSVENVYWYEEARDRWRVLPRDQYNVVFRRYNRGESTSNVSPYGLAMIGFTLVELLQTGEDIFELPDGTLLTEYSAGFFADVYGIPKLLTDDDVDPNLRTLTEPLEVIGGFLQLYTSFYFEYSVANNFGAVDREDVYYVSFLETNTPVDGIHDYDQYRHLTLSTPVQVGGVLLDSFTPEDVIRSLAGELGVQIVSVPPLSIAVPGTMAPNIAVRWYDMPTPMQDPDAQGWPYTNYARASNMRDWIGRRAATEAENIGDGTFAPLIEDVERVTNDVNVRIGRDYGGNADQGFISTTSLVNTESVDEIGRDALTIDSGWLRDEGSARDVTAMRLWRFQQGQVYYTYQTGMRESNRIPGDLAMLRFVPLQTQESNVEDFTGLNATLTTVTAVEIDLQRCTVSATMIGSVGMLGPYCRLADELTAPATWADIPLNQVDDTELLYLCDEVTGILDTGTNFTQPGKVLMGGYL